MFLKSLKQETARTLKQGREHLWEPRYYDFNVFTARKRNEKIEYIHHNPVIRGLASSAGQYLWSSYADHATGNPGTVTIARP
jgi:putative transposase